MSSLHVAALALLAAAQEARPASLLPGQTLRLEFPDLPPTLMAMQTGSSAPPSVTVRLPDDYLAAGEFPLFVHLEGGHGGGGANLHIPLRTSQGKGFVAANFPLFKNKRPDPDRSWTLAIGADDAPKIAHAFAAILARLNEMIPNLDPARSILGGHSNGANTIAALLSVLDPTTL